LLSLTAFIARQSRGMPLNVSIEGPERKHFDAGEAAYRLRRGQMNLSCAHCHEANWGKRLLSETISQGHPNGYPVYRMEWQTMGSLERRLRACLSGVRAKMLLYGSPEYLDLELYLAWRAQGLPVETPGVRR
jgi:sulfur-oxidizing protein SoxA